MDLRTAISAEAAARVSQSSVLRQALGACLRLGVFVSMLVVGLGFLAREHREDVLEQPGIRLERAENGEIAGISLHDPELSAEQLQCLSGLRSLRRCIVSSGTPSSAMLRAIRDLPDLRVLVCRECQLCREHLESMKEGQLSTLELSRSQGQDIRVEQLSELTSLEHLSLDGCDWVTDDSLRTLAKLPELRFLDLSRTAVSAKGVAHLKGCLLLERIQLEDCRDLSDQVLDSLCVLPKLRHADVSGAPVSLARLAQFVADNPQIKVRYSEASAPDLQLLMPRGPVSGSAGRVHRIDASLETATDLSVLQYLNELRALRLSGAGVDNLIFPALQGLRQLRELDLSASGIAEYEFSKSLSGLQLHALNLSDTRVGCQTWDWISAQNSLQTLKLARTGFPWHTDSRPLTFPELRTLDLSGNRLPAGQLNRLLAPQLQVLELSHCGLADSDLTGLNRFQQLRFLDVSGNSIATIPGTVLSAAPLQSLSLAGTECRGDSLTSFVAGKPAAHFLDVSDVKLKGSDLAGLRGQTIWHLAMRGYNIDNEHLSALNGMKSVGILDLRNSRLSEDFWTSLDPEVLRGHFVLDGDEQIVAALASSNFAARLTSVSLAHPEANLFPNLGQFPSLKTLVLYDCVLDEPTASALCCLPSLRTLELVRCQLLGEALTQLDEESAIEQILLHQSSTQHRVAQTSSTDSRIRILRTEHLLFDHQGRN